MLSAIQTALSWAAMLIFAAAALYNGGLAALRWINTPKVCVDERRIAEVGGCDLLGTCGVTFTDGTHGQWSRPAPGQSVCLKKDYPPDPPTASRAGASGESR